VQFLEENAVESFEIVKIVYKNKMNSTNTLKSGEQFKIISKNIR